MHVEGGLEQNLQGEPDDHEHEQHVEGHVLSGVAQVVADAVGDQRVDNPQVQKLPEKK